MAGGGWGAGRETGGGVGGGDVVLVLGKFVWCACCGLWVCNALRSRCG